MSYQNTLEHVGKASDDLVIFDSLLTMVERVNKLVSLFLFLLQSGGREELLPRSQDPGHSQSESENSP